MSVARGRFITLEGGEGAGKTTVARRLKDTLEKRGTTVVLTREPGGSPGAEEIRRLIVEGEPGRWEPLAETLLFLAARADHIARTIRPALQAGKWVISDRFTDSTVAYQGAARGLGAAFVENLSRAALGDFTPDLTLVLDIDPATGLRRAAGRGEGHSRFEKFDEDFHRKLRTAFRAIARAHPERCVLIDATPDADAVARAALSAISARLAA